MNHVFRKRFSPASRAESSDAASSLNRGPRRGDLGGAGRAWLPPPRTRAVLLAKPPPVRATKLPQAGAPPRW